jgi:hypothetical protein
MAAVNASNDPTGASTSGSKNEFIPLDTIKRKGKM